ncbi:unnamed protein product [Chironomus riparius]|uniref:Uncharacterized protein n=1 Tax=Chironomus riparius TaxID=315576 RepID=A0A9N9WPM2_9DIPT|nr:unnamed protein product [Chironomus riparius]
MEEKMTEQAESTKSRLSRGERRLLLLRYTSLLFQIQKAENNTAMEIQRIMVHYNVIRRKFDELNVSSDELVDLLFEQFVRDRMNEETNRAWDRYVYDGADSTWEEMCSFMDERTKTLYKTQNFGSK